MTKPGVYPARRRCHPLIFSKIPTITDHCNAAPIQANVRWTKLVKNIDASHTIPYVLNSGVIKLNLTKISIQWYRNTCRLICWNRKCDIPIHFRKPACRMNDNRRIAANYYVLSHFNSKTTETTFRNFLHDVTTTILHCPQSTITRQRTSVDSKLLYSPRNVGYYHIFER